MKENEALECLKSSKRKNDILGILPGSDIGTGRKVGRNIVYILRDVPEYGLMTGYVIFGW